MVVVLPPTSCSRCGKGLANWIHRILFLCTHPLHL